MAATRIMSIHIGKNKTARQCITERLDYIMNPEKTNGGNLISSFACSPETAADDFLLFRQAYQMNTGRSPQNEVIAYHVRQAFKPGEVTPEEANEIGRELAETITGNHHAFVVATHIDKSHVHNHLIFSSVDLDGQHKFRDVKRSAKDVVAISDALCIDHGLSVIREPQDKTVSYDRWQGSQKKFTHRDELRMIVDAALRMQPDGFDTLIQLMENAGCQIKRGAHISVKPLEGKRYIRLDTLGPEYDEFTLRRTLAGEHAHIPKIPRGDFNESQVKRLVDIEAKLREGKGKGYVVWAERNNIDAKAQMIIFLKEHDIGSISELENQIHVLQTERNALHAAIREKQTRMKEINRQRQAIRDYGRTKQVYSQFRESGWSQKFYIEHREEIEVHRNAQDVYAYVDGKMPTLKDPTAEYDALKKENEADRTILEEVKLKLANLKSIRHNYEILERDALPMKRYRPHSRGEVR